MNVFKVLRKGLSRLHTFYYRTAEDVPSSKRILYVLNNKIYLDVKTVQQHRDTVPALSMEETIQQQNEYHNKIISIINLKNTEKEKEEIERYLTDKRIPFESVDSIDPNKITARTPFYSNLLREQYSFSYDTLEKYHRSYWIEVIAGSKIRIVVNLVRLFIAISDVTILKRIGQFSEYKRVATYLRKSPKKSHSYIEVSWELYPHLPIKMYSVEMENTNLILDELVGIDVAIPIGNGEYKYNPKGQVKFKEMSTKSLLSLATIGVPVIALVCYVLTNAKAMHDNCPGILKHMYGGSYVSTRPLRTTCPGAEQAQVSPGPLRTTPERNNSTRTDNSLNQISPGPGDRIQEHPSTPRRSLRPVRSSTSCPPDSGDSGRYKE